MSINKLVLNLKEEGQDFEFYPSTDEMISAIEQSFNIGIHEHYGSWLDIGAGNGNFYNKFFKIVNQKRKNDDRKYCMDYFVIEKSKILRDSLPINAVVVGCDFKNNSLIDKKVSNIFCNPPYLEFEDWTERILKESNFTDNIFLIIPERWKNNQKIMNLLTVRGLSYKIIMTTDFLDAERAARAKVDIVRITHKEQEYKRLDGFDLFLHDLGFSQKETKYSYERKQEKQEKLENVLIEKKDIIDTLITCYDNDLSQLVNNYKMIGSLDNEIFLELGIDIKKVKEALQQRIAGLKYLYWEMVFARLDGITSRLITKNREQFLKDLISRTNIDFNLENIYAVIDYVIKNCIKYFDDQLKDIYLEMSSLENIKNYKSNTKTFKNDGWRYIDSEGNTVDKKELKNYSLDYRIVLSNIWNLKIINDIAVIANNLGFINNFHTKNIQSDSFGRNPDHVYGVEYEVFYDKGLLFKYRVYKNKNIHIKLNQEFLKSFNIEASRLFGWIKSKEHAVEEIFGIDLCDAEKYFRSNLSLINSGSLLKLDILK